VSNKFLDLLFKGNKLTSIPLSHYFTIRNFVSDKILKVEDADGFQYEVFSSNYRLASTDQSLPYGKPGLLRKG